MLTDKMLALGDSIAANSPCKMASITSIRCMNICSFARDISKKMFYCAGVS